VVDSDPVIMNVLLHLKTLEHILRLLQEHAEPVVLSPSIFAIRMHKMTKKRVKKYFFINSIFQFNQLNGKET